MSANAQTLRQLSIKTGVVRRLFKEEQTYKDEVAQAEKNLAKLREDDADGADIRNAERVVKDSEQMVPRTRSSLEDAVTALEDLTSALASEDDIVATSEYKAAKMQLDTVQDAWKGEKESK